MRLLDDASRCHPRVIGHHRQSGRRVRAADLLTIGTAVTGAVGSPSNGCCLAAGPA